jgi:PAS domain S-box-containing protein
MIALRARPLRSVLVGDDALGERLSGRVDNGDREQTLAVETVDPATIGDLGHRHDCVLVDGAELGDECVDVVAACTDEQPGVPVVLLSDGAPEVAADALAAGATETLPRAVAEVDPDVAVGQLVSAIERERARRGFGEVFESVSDGLVVHDPETGEIRAVNERYCELTGYDREELVGGTIQRILPQDPTDSLGDTCEWIERAREEGPQLFEFEGERADGEPFVGEVHLGVIDFHGETQVLASVRDVTERTRREHEYEEIFNSVNDTIAVIDPESGEMVDVNESLCGLVGYGKEELLEMDPPDISIEDEGFTEERGREIIDSVIESGEPHQTEWMVETRDGSVRWLDVNGTSATIGGETRYLSIGRDITERKRREREHRERERMVESLHDATERLQEAETTEAACRTTVEAARDVLGLPMTACWLHRETPDGPALEPVAATDPVREIDPRPLRPGDVEYEAFCEGEPLVCAPSESFPGTHLDAAIVLPLGEHGLLAAGKRGVSEYDEFVVDAARILSGHVRTALDRIARARSLRENERRLGAILDRIDEAIFLAPAAEIDDSDPATDYVSAGYEDVYGLSLETMHETYDEGFFGVLHPDEYDGYWALVERIRRETEAGESADRYSREYRIVPPDGDRRWIHSDFYPTEWNGERKLVVVSRDVTDRKERERTLESFHDATAELTTAETADEAADVAVRAAAEVFELPATAVYSYDDQQGALVPAASGPAVGADLPTLTAENDHAWTAFVEERMRRVATEEAPAVDLGRGEEALFVPLGGNGLFVVWAGEDLDPDAATIIAATVEAALNRVQGERRLESRNEELRAQVERARRLEAVTELTRRVEAAITAESSRQGVQEAVCEELTDVEPFEVASVAGADIGTDRLTPRAVAGVDRDRAERVLDAGDPDADPHPAFEAWRTGETAVVENLVNGRRSDWRRLLLSRGAGSLCAVPLAYRGVTHGVLSIVADEPDAFGEREREVLDQLGTSIGYAITAIERQRALESDETLELEFRGSGRNLPFARLARAADSHVCHERTVRRQNGSVSVYYTLADPPDDAAATADAVLPGTVETVTRTDGEAVLERQGSSWFGAIVSEYGGVLRRGEATPADATLVVELPREADTRTIVEHVENTFPDLELTAQRHHRDTATTTHELASQLHRRLTDRQREVLETAHAMGYFDWPRTSSGEDVAAALDITQPTVNKHMRFGERKVFDLLFETDGASDIGG